MEKNTGQMKLKFVHHYPDLMETINDVALRQPLMEVFNMTIFYIDENVSNLYGTISVYDYFNEVRDFSIIVYNRYLDNPESICSDYQITLTGPTQAVKFGGNSCVFNFNIKGKDSNGSSDGEVINERFTHTFFKYDTPLAEVVKGKLGALKIQYAIVSNAIEACLELRFVDYDESYKEIPLHGTFTASTDKFPEYKIMLLDAHSFQPMSLNKCLVPLSRSTVVVPFGYILTVEVRILNKKSNDHNIASKSFAAQLPGCFSRDKISSRYGKFMVTIGWI